MQDNSLNQGPQNGSCLGCDRRVVTKVLFKHFNLSAKELFKIWNRRRFNKGGPMIHSHSKLNLFAFE
jgi:hypothetical protein